MLFFYLIIVPYNRSILGITAHYEHNGQIVTRLIGIRRLLASHTGAIIVKTVQNTLKLFKVCLEDVYCISTDNGANSFRAVTVFRLFQSHQMDDFLLNDLPFFEREQAYAGFIDKEIKKHGDELSNASGKYVFSVHCAAHTMELGVRDALKISHEELTVIERARTMVKKLRTDSLMNLITMKKTAETIHR